MSKKQIEAEMREVDQWLKDHPVTVGMSKSTLDAVRIYTEKRKRLARQLKEADDAD